MSRKTQIKRKPSKTVRFYAIRSILSDLLLKASGSGRVVSLKSDSFKNTHFKLFVLAQKSSAGKFSVTSVTKYSKVFFVLTQKRLWPTELCHSETNKAGLESETVFKLESSIVDNVDAILNGTLVLLSALCTLLILPLCFAFPSPLSLFRWKLSLQSILGAVQGFTLNVWALQSVLWQQLWKQQWQQKLNWETFCSEHKENIEAACFLVLWDARSEVALWETGRWHRMSAFSFTETNFRVGNLNM